MNIKRKKIIVYGLGRLQQDFEYLFPKLKVCGYIVNDKKIKEYNDKFCYYKKDIDKKIVRGKIIIVCERKNNRITKYLNKKGFVEKKHFFYLEDIGYLLNDKYEELSYKLYKLYYKKVKKWKHYPVYVPNEKYFKDMIYKDSFENFKCYFPFKYVQVQPKGFVFPCCEGWIKKDIGNITFRNPNKVWHSNLAKIHRLSIINKTYLFCNSNTCPFMSKDKVPTNTRFDDLVPSKTPEDVCVAIDTSCNLMCRSCRNKRYNIHKGRHYWALENLARKLIRSGWCNKATKLIMSSQGEVFFSKIYKKMLYESKITKRDSVCIHTNGTLLTKSNLDRLCKHYSDLEFMISIDAASEETYKYLRRGGNFDFLVKNLENLSKVKKEGKVRKVNLLYVVQKYNYKEMPDFVKLAKRLEFDNVEFSVIQNWGTYSKEEFKDISMLDDNGNPKSELIEVLKDPIFKDKIITSNYVLNINVD